MRQKGKQILHVLSFTRDINFSRKEFENRRMLFRPMDIHICGVDMRAPTSRILAQFLLTCRRCAISRQEYVGIGSVYGNLSDFAAG